MPLGEDTVEPSKASAVDLVRSAAPVATTTHGSKSEVLGQRIAVEAQGKQATPSCRCGSCLYPSRASVLPCTSHFKLKSLCQ